VLQVEPLVMDWRGHVPASRYESEMSQRKINGFANIRSRISRHHPNEFPSQTFPQYHSLASCYYIIIYLQLFLKPLQNVGNHSRQTGRTQSEKSPPWLNATLHDIGGAVRK